MKGTVLAGSSKIRPYISISFKNAIFIFVGVLLILIAGLRPIGLDRDSLAYVSVLHIRLLEANFLSKEPTFWIINEINHILFNGNPKTFFLMFSILGVGLKILAIRKLSNSPIFSLFTYICLYFVLHEMTQIRVGVASAIFLLSIPDIYNRNLSSFLFKTFMATMFHYSAIIMLPLYLLHPRKINFRVFFFLPLIGMAFMFILNNYFVTILNSLLFLFPKFLANKIELYIFLLHEGIFSESKWANPYYIFLYVFYSFLYYFMILYCTYFKSKYDILFIKIFAMMLFSFYFFSSIPIFAGRISEFFGVVLIILIPHFSLIFKQKTIIRIGLILWLSTYFIYTTLKILNF